MRFKTVSRYYLSYIVVYLGFLRQQGQEQNNDRKAKIKTAPPFLARAVFIIIYFTLKKFCFISSRLTASVNISGGR